MLLNTFYKEINLTYDESKGSITSIIKFNCNHAVFKGHFPGNPVVPGVCMIQIIDEILSANINRQYSLKECSNIKFLSVLNPDIYDEVNVLINYKIFNNNQMQVNASITAESKNFIKFQGFYK